MHEPVYVRACMKDELRLLLAIYGVHSLKEARERF
jgi:hypothetical protein